MFDVQFPGIPVPGTFSFFYGIGTSLEEKNWHQKVLGIVLGKTGTKISLVTGLGNILYRKKSQNRPLGPSRVSLFLAILVLSHSPTTHGIRLFLCMFLSTNPLEYAIPLSVCRHKKSGPCTFLIVALYWMIRVSKFN